ncbi:hypothetical protein HGRIS_007434 [Hohenbuehelia grisea]|uniref:NAD(P)-binding domain-containing protein n=1 Tax=Hohenbuehelia grisea TaxID=104357 RepID=A0ABR3J560_9AGAR
MTRILILGATGAIGILVVREFLAVQPSPTIVIFARTPDKLPSDIKANPRVVVIKGELTDSDGLAKSLEGVDVVVSTLGPLVSKGPLHPSGTPLAKAYERLIELMMQQSVKRLIALGTASITDPADKFSLKFSAMVLTVSTLARTAYKDVVAIGEAIRSQGADLDWTIVRVPVLTNGQSKEFTTGYLGDSKLGTSLSRAACAAFIVAEVGKEEWVKKAPMVTSV